MNANCKLALALLVGAAVGTAAVQGLHAQAKPPVYVITDIGEITDAEGYKAIGQRPRAAAEANVKELGGRYLSRTNNITAIDGTAPKRIIIAVFDSAEKAQAWANSKDQKEVSAIRMKTTTSRSFMAEGL